MKIPEAEAMAAINDVWLILCAGGGGDCTAAVGEAIDVTREMVAVLPVIIEMTVE